MLKKLVLALVIAALGGGCWYGWQYYNTREEEMQKNHIEKNFSFESVINKRKHLRAHRLSIQTVICLENY